MTSNSLTELTICIKGAGEMASGIACRLFTANFKRIVMLEMESPLAVRRKVAFSEAVHEGSQIVEGIEARRVSQYSEVSELWDNNRIGVIVDPQWNTLQAGSFNVTIDAILAKKNLGTVSKEAPLVIGLGPGFTAGEDVDIVIETNRGHDLGRVIKKGSAEPNTGVPGNIGNYTSERVLRAPEDGVFTTNRLIGEMVSPGEVIGQINHKSIYSQINGIIRGLIREQTQVKKHCKLGDIDPRGKINYCSTVSEKARAIGGAVLETVLAEFNK